MRLTALTLFAGLVGLALPSVGSAQYPGWAHTGVVNILTTPDGANLPASALVRDFPLLVRLHKDFFNFSQAKPKGDDLRFSTAGGVALKHQIEEWDAQRGEASIWVRIPEIKGNARQEIRLHWGKADAAPESDGQAVFNESNGHIGVFHMAGPIKDETGKLQAKDVRTTEIPGIIGRARRLAGGQGVTLGEKITHFPTGSASHTTEAWFRPEKPNGNVMAWGNEHGQGKVVMHFRSPPHVKMECYFSGADVAGESRMTMNEWVHVVHTYEKGNSRLYVNGVLDGKTVTASAPLAIKTPARMYIGGWYDNYNFIGDVDEVRVSNVVRSPHWVRLQFENQKTLQTVVGPVVPAGTDFSVSSKEVTIAEGKSATLTARAGGAQKIYWSVKRDGRETVVATDRLAYTFDAGRVVGDARATIILKIVDSTGVRVSEVPVTIREAIPEPAFTLRAPARWDGRQPIEVIPQITNAAEMSAAGADKPVVRWLVDGMAVIKEAQPGKLLLKRSQNSGKLTVTAAIGNGGRETVQSVVIDVTEPKADAWVSRTPGASEQPVDGQFYARDDKNEGTLFYNGKLAEPADQVFLKLSADDKPVTELTQKPGEGGAYGFAMKLKPGLVKYKVEFGIKTGGAEKVLRTVTNIVCGDAYVITGQSNAVATDFGRETPAFRSDWIRTFGGMSGNPKGEAGWGNAMYRGKDSEKFQIGYWGMELGRRLVETHQIPVFLINGAVGGTRVDQHQRNDADPEDMTTIYGRLLWRVRQAGLTHGIRGILWHQGENDQGADGPTGGYGFETYRQFFIDLSASWKSDFPNVKHYYVFQIWPKSCSMGVNGSDNRLREVQRNLPRDFSNLSVMSTLGIDPPGGCHFPAAGYAEFARMIAPLVERDHYGKKPTGVITPANLRQVFFANDQHNELALEFDQPVRWDNKLVGEFQLDGKKGLIASGEVQGNVLRLRLKERSTAKTITYLDSASWSQQRLLKGENGIAALTFCETPIVPTPVSR